MTDAPSSETGQGVRCLILSSLAFSLMTVCVKQLDGRLPVPEIVLSRALISVGLTGLGLNRAGVSPWGQHTGWLLARGICGSLALLCFFEAITTLPLASATVLQYTYPTFTAVAAAIVLREQLRRSIAVAILLGWIGITLVAQPDWLNAGLEKLPTTAVLIALGGAFFTALAYVCVRHLSSREHPLVIILYFPVLSIPLTLPMVIRNGVLPMGGEWLWLLGIGVLTQLGQIWVTRGLCLMPAAQATSGGGDTQNALFAAINARRVKQEQRMADIAAGKVEPLDPREQREKELAEKAKERLRE